ncbi:hypothetical protein GE21DRAFT_1199882 [Neurospora crassa]|nr:hypothetical protein 1A9.30 [imported] - Neurospora crassa [Neurospora crassa]KHE88345.1 hypothetical protein GE21DRAFT_1199882 [Neurospora crassa]
MLVPCPAKQVYDFFFCHLRHCARLGYYRQGRNDGVRRDSPSLSTLNSLTVEGYEWPSLEEDGRHTRRTITPAKTCPLDALCISAYRGWLHQCQAFGSPTYPCLPNVVRSLRDDGACGSSLCLHVTGLSFCQIPAFHLPPSPEFHRISAQQRSQQTAPFTLNNTSYRSHVIVAETLL